MVKRLLSTVGLALMLASCAGAPSAAGPATSTAATATPSVVPTASRRPSPVVSTKGFITLTSPTVNATLQSPVIITGDASVFEATLQWRITDTGGRVIAEGITTASQGAPGRGTFSVTATYTVSTETVAFVEVYSRSAKDGNIDELVRVPVTLR
jgi:hypothetical protein